jgi:DNA-binding transcriptional MerR regulator/effector-binding domain-containing protein
MFRIGDFSKLSFVSIRMLRYYDEVGIFKPAYVDDFTGFRYYTAKQFPIINKIVQLRDLGFNVAEIQTYLAQPDRNTREQILQNKLSEIEQNITLEQIKIHKIKFAIQNLNKENEMTNYEVEIKSVPSYQMLALREIIPAYDREGDLWMKLGTYAKQTQAPLKENGICFAVYYDETKLENGVDVEVLQEVQTIVSADSPYQYRTTQALPKVAAIIVKGEYTNIAPAFTFLGAWLEENNIEIAGQPRQLPFIGPWNAQNPSEYRTEIQIPIK